MLKEKLEKYVEELEETIEKSDADNFENIDRYNGRILGYQLVLSDIKHILSLDSQENNNEDFYNKLKNRYEHNLVAETLELLNSNGFITDEEYNDEINYFNKNEEFSYSMVTIIVDTMDYR